MSIPTFNLRKLDAEKCDRSHLPGETCDAEHQIFLFNDCDCRGQRTNKEMHFWTVRFDKHDRLLHLECPDCAKDICRFEVAP